ncbi:MAG: hypothetical protein FT714_12190 [Pantoea sp. Pent]|nr:hypothetical protein [Pantoea sp. Pent]
MSKKPKKIYMALFVYGFVFCVNAQLYVELRSQPSNPNDRFAGIIIGGDENDPDPNPCYQVYNCSLRAYINSESWGESGKEGYGTVDKFSPSGWSTASQNAATLGEFVKMVRASGSISRLMEDYLPSSYGKDPIFCMYAGRYNSSTNSYYQIANTLISNCARGRPFPSICKIKEMEVNYDFGRVIPQHTQELIKENFFN